MVPVVALLAATVSVATPVSDNCKQAILPDIDLPHLQATSRGGRAVDPRDLVTLRDFGSPHWRDIKQPPFRVSPDGRFAAIVLRRANPDTDSYCFGIVIVAIDGSQAPRLVDHGGEPMLETADVRGLANLPIGNVLAETPFWSPDGRWVAYLRRDGGQNRIWRAAADGLKVEEVAKVADDARISGWSSDGAIVVRSRPGLAAANAAISREEREGFLFDARFWPLASARPFASGSLPLAEQAIGVGGKNEKLTASRALPQDAVSETPQGAIRSMSGALAWVASEDPAIFLSARPLNVRHGQRTIICRSALCRDGVDALWWRGGDTLYFVRHGSASDGGETILARWDLARESEPIPILTTQDALEGCIAEGDGALCTRETPTHPRTLVRIDLYGIIKTLFDPNGDFTELRKGEVRRLTWQSRDGTAAYGDLVLPLGHRSGESHPLIIVQYHSRGFLRGGTGDEYPIHAFASRGFAVLSIERPSFIGAGRARSLDEFMKVRTERFAERRRVQASVEAGILAAHKTGAIDATRIGITGLSDGAATVQFGLLHSSLFKAAAISSCCDEASGAFVADRGYAELLRKAGYPAREKGNAFWREMSLAANARRIRTPILMQLTDDEFRLGLETFTALDRANAPVEMYIFAGGYHLKYRPAHRLASYTRSIDWFDFWLNSKVRPDLVKTAQYTRWRALAARQQ